MGDPLATNLYTNQTSGIHYWSGSSSGWKQATYDLAQFNNAAIPVQFRFHFFSNASGSNDGFAIDDFSIELPTIPFDAGVISIDAPISSTVIGSMGNSVTVTVENFGSSTINAIPVSYKVGNNTVSNEVINVTGGLAPGATTSYTFNTTYQGPVTAYTLCAKTSLANDTYVQNNEKCKAIAVTTAALDAGITYVVADPSWHDTTKIVNPTSVRIRIKNYGLTTLTTIPVQYNVGAFIANETWNGSLAYGDSATYVFNTTYQGPVGNYQLCAKVVTPDANPANDQKCHSYLGINDVGIDGTDGDKFSVSQNQPNPAYGEVKIQYYLPQSGQVKFELRNTLGQLIQSEEYDRSAGVQMISLDANKLNAGVYYYTVEYDEQRITHKMVVNN
jgi:hypothetical protein